MSKPRLLVITGSSGVGKSTLSARAAASLGFSKSASTDTIREALRPQFDADELPALHRSSFESAGSGVVEAWHETVKVLSEGGTAVVRRASMKGADLLLEGVHLIPGAQILNDWRGAGGIACGVVLYVEEGGRHQRFIMRRERHNNRGLAHYLDNLDRIREIQNDMVSNGRDAGWLVMDASAQDDPVGMVEASFE